MKKINIFWFRRDLRLDDNAGLYHALKAGIPVQPIFIFDKNILDKLPKEDARVNFIHATLKEVNEQLKSFEASLDCRYDTPEKAWQELTEAYDIQTVFTNRDYEPYAKDRDQSIKDFLNKKGIELKAYKDHVIFNHGEVVKDNGEPYHVFTPYSKKWYAKLDTKGNGANSYYLKAYPTLKYSKNLLKNSKTKIPELIEMGFKTIDKSFPPKTVSQKLIKNYDEQRNFPAIEGTSKLGMHFRFGTISVRGKAKKAYALNKTFVNELIWRDFYSTILDHYPRVVSNSFRVKYDRIEWRNNEHEFDAWTKGMTGYPLVDAGMRELNTTGLMHNRVRMVVASFLTKHLLIDWRWGEAYFAEKLLDYDLASNNGGWQWAAGTGTDAAPYFRIFNPESQLKKFDKELKYTKHWVPELDTADYPDPIVDHREARERCLRVYKEGLA